MKHSVRWRLGFSLPMAAIALAVAAAPAIGAKSTTPEAGSAATESEAAKAEDSVLTVGSKAPAIDIQHWVQDGEGRFEPIKEFAPGKVYVVEFWATWCGPCVASMPHLSKLQQQYADRGVQIISVSDEPLETVTGFLKGEVRGKKNAADAEPMTYQKLTSSYCLTTDPDGSVNRDYMEAAMQMGIPSAFLVGKQGVIEWIGHPMSMDEPLRKVVEDAWDRDAFAKEYEAQQQSQRGMMQIANLCQDKKFDEARRVAAKMTEAAQDPNQVEMAEYMTIAIELEEFKQFAKKDPVAATSKLSEIVEMSGENVNYVMAAANAVLRVGKRGEIDAKLLEATATALRGMVGEVKPNARVLMTLARVVNEQGQLEEAISLQEKAVAAAKNGRVKQRAEMYLEQLRGKKEAPKEAAASEATSGENS